MDGFWTGVERIQQRGEMKKEDCGGSRSQLLEGEASWTCKLDVQALFQGKHRVRAQAQARAQGSSFCLDCCSSLSTELPAICFLLHCQKGLPYKVHRFVSI